MLFKKKKEENKDIIKRDSLRKAYLCICRPKDENKGIDWYEFEYNEFMIHNDGWEDFDAVHDQLIIEKVKPIIMINQNFTHPDRIKEYLTGESFNYIIERERLIGTSIDTEHFNGNNVFILETHYRNDNSYVSAEDVLEYMNIHSDIEAYRKELQSYKDYDYELHDKIEKNINKAIQTEEKKEYMNEMKWQLIEKGKEEINSHPCVKDICLDIIEKNDKYLKAYKIDNLLSDLKYDYPNLSNDEYTSLAIVLLKLQADDKIKEFIK